MLTGSQLEFPHKSDPSSNVQSEDQLADLAGATLL